MHGTNLSTELLFETSDKFEFKRVAVGYSQRFGVVDSNEWANLKLEEGDGGDTVSDKMWITNGIDEKYLKKDLPVPLGWRCGRSDSCVFKNKEKQKDFASRIDRSDPKWKKIYKENGKKHRALRKVRYWCSSHLHTPETKAKIKEKALLREFYPFSCIKCRKVVKHTNHFGKCCG